ncbi:hypothetical protein Tco_1136183 [Tanacetum coccineum]
MITLEQQLTKETILESNCQNAFRVLKTQFEKIFTSVLIKPSSLDVDDERGTAKREYTSIGDMKDMIQQLRKRLNRSKAMDSIIGDTENIRPIYDEEPMAEVQTTAEINVFATGQQHTEQPEFNNEGEVDQNAEQSKNIEHTTSLIANNDKFKAQLQEKGFAIAALKNELRKLTGNSVNTKFAKSSILGKPALQPRRNQSVVRQPTAFKSERPSFSKQRYSLNDMVHNHYLEEAKKKNTKAVAFQNLVIPSARSQSTANGSKPKPRINNQKSRNWPASKSNIGLKWIPTGKIFTSSTTKVDSEPTNGSNDDITNQYECKQTLDVSAGLAPPRQMTSDHNSSELGIHNHNNEPSSSKLLPKVFPLVDKTVTSRQGLELLFHHHITMLSYLGKGFYGFSDLNTQQHLLFHDDSEDHNVGNGKILRFELENPVKVDSVESSTDHKGYIRGDGVAS